MQQYDNQRHEFTPQDVEIVSKETLFRGFSRWLSTHLNIDCLRAAGANQ